MCPNKSKEQYEIEKLQLEIKDMSAPLWKHPGFLASVCTGLVGIVIGYFSGFFDIKLGELKNQRELLKIETLQLADRKKELTKTNRLLELKIKELETELKEESTPKLQTLNLEARTSKEVGYWINNLGKGVAFLEPYVIFLDGDIDKKYIIHSLDDWHIVLGELNIDEPWVRMLSVRPAGSKIEPGGKKLVIRMEPSEFTIDRYYKFMNARERIGLITYYSTSQGDRNVFLMGKLPSILTEEYLLKNNIAEGASAQEVLLKSIFKNDEE